MEEQKIEPPVKEEKYFHIENVGKNIWTTVIGCLLMGASSGLVIYSQIVELPNMKLWVMGLVFVAGFALLFMRDKLPTYIDIFTKKKIG